MADLESIREHLLAVEKQTQVAYDAVLELHAIIAVFVELERPPTWAFPLERMAERARDHADLAHGSIFQIPGVLELLAPRSAVEARS